jgi:hypothetical protein
MNIINSAPLPATGWGAAIGTGIHDVLDNLARQKAEEMYYRKQKKRSAETYEPLFGKKGSEFLAGLPPEIQKIVLQNPGFLQQLFPEEGGLPQGQSPEQLQQYQQPQESMMSPLNNIAQPNAEQLQYLEKLANPLGTKKPELPRFGNIEPEAGILAGLNQPVLKAQAAEQQVRQQGQNVVDKSKLIAEAFTSPQERIKREEIALKREKAARESRREERELTAKEKEKNAELIDTRKNLQDYVKTAETALNHAKKASFNPATSWLAENPHLRGQLDKESSAFDTEATKLFNLGAQLIKGPVSVQRLKGIAREKASLGKNRQENVRYLQDAIKAGKQQLQIFDKENPNIIQKYKEAAPEEESNYKGTDAYQENGKYYLWDAENNEYRAAKLKGK